MASTVAKSISLKSARTYAAQAAAAQQTNYSLPYHQPQVSKLPSGAVVASLENNSPIASVSISFKAGARYESGSNTGVSHVTRVCSGLGTGGATAFKITRLIQQLGGNVVSENGREHISYTLNVNRDHLTTCLSLLGDLASQPVYHSWEVATQVSRIKCELESRQPISFVLDSLHNAAFRHGLGNSIFVPDFGIKTAASPSVLKEYHNSTHTADRMSVSGFGVEHHDLLSFAKSLQVGPTGSNASSSTYKGGDVRTECGGGVAYLAVAGQGSKIGHEDSAAYTVAQYVLGVGPSLKYSHPAAGKLHALVKEAGGSGIASTININYSDNGLFGFYMQEEASKAGSVCSAVVKGLKSLKVTKADVDVAKIRAKSAVAIGMESQESGIEDMSLQSLYTGNYLALPQIQAALDKVDVAAVQKALSKSFGGKLSLGSIGSLENMPYSDEL